MFSDEDKVKSRLKKGFSVNLLSFLINLTTQILLVPILLLNWGVSLYGEWIILSSLSAYILLSNFGISDASANEMTILCSRGELKSAQKIFQSSWVIITLITLIMSIIVFSIIHLNSTQYNLGIKIISHNDFLLISNFLILYVFVSIQLSVFGSVYKAVKKSPKSITILNYTRSLEFLFGIAFVFTGYGPKAFIISNLIIRFLGLIFTVYYLKINYPWLKIRIKNNKLTDIRGILKPSLASGGFSLGNILMNQGVILLVGSFLGSASVVILNTIRSYTRMLLKVSAIIINTYSPEMSIYYGQNKLNSLKLLNRKLMKSSFLLSLIITLISYFVGEFIIGLWIKDKIEIDHTLYLLILLETLIYSIWYVGSVSITAANKHFNIVVGYVLTGFLSMLLIYFLIPKFGLNAVPVSLIISNLIIIYYVIIQMLKITNDTFLNFLKFIFNYKPLLKL